MLTLSTNPWLTSWRIVALIAVVALAVSLALAMFGNSWTAYAASEDLVVAGPSWTLK